MSSVRTVLPLALATGTGMLAMDLFLPAVPAVQKALGTGVEPAQATVSVFLVGLAASQLVWGEAMRRYGPRRCVLLGVGLLAAAGIGCALAPGIEMLLAMRALQGVAAGAATVVAPSVVRASLGDADAVRGMATIAMVESAIPAGGPVLGAALLLHLDWRGTFWILALVTLAALPLLARVVPRELPGLDRRVQAGYRDILGDRRYRRVGAAHALCFGALLTFVASAPQLMEHALGLGPPAFAALQVMSVAAFMLTASQAGRISRRLGAAGAIRLGASLHVALCAAWALASWRLPPSFPVVAAFWCAFCAALAVRGPAAFSEALSLPPAQMGRATAMLMLAILLAGALGTQGVAPFVGGASSLPLALAMLGFSAASLGLLVPYPPARVAGVARGGPP